MNKTEWQIVGAGVIVTALLLVACLVGQQIEQTNAVEASVDVLRAEVVRLQMELDTLRRVKIELTVVDKSTPVRVVEVTQ